MPSPWMGPGGPLLVVVTPSCKYRAILLQVDIPYSIDVVVV